MINCNDWLQQTRLMCNILTLNNFSRKNIPVLSTKIKWYFCTNIYLHLCMTIDYAIDIKNDLLSIRIICKEIDHCYD